MVQMTQTLNQTLLQRTPLVLQTPVSMEVDVEMWVVPDTTAPVVDAGLDKTVKLE